MLTYPRPPWPGRRVSTVCVPPFRHRVMTDPAPPCARRGMAVRVPPRGHRVLTYPRPPRPGRRVSAVCVPPFWHRVMSNPAPPCARRHGRPSAATRAPGADVPPAIPAEAPGQHRLRAVAITTVALPAGSHRPRQEGLPRVPANPRTLTHPHTHQHTAHTRTAFSHDYQVRPILRKHKSTPLHMVERGRG